MSDKLLAASIAGEGDTVTKLLQQGVSVNSKRVDGHTGLHLSIIDGHDDIVKIYLDHKADVNIRGFKDLTPLMISSGSGHLTITKHLLEHGAEVNLQNADGDTALIIAVRWGHSEVANVLKSNGADENIENNAGESACKLSQMYQIKKLISAAATGDGDTVTRLLQEGVSVNSKQENGNTGLHVVLCQINTTQREQTSA